MKFAHVRSSPAKATKEVIFSLDWEGLLHPAIFHTWPFPIATCTDQCSHICQVSDSQKWIDGNFAAKSTSFYHEGVYKLPDKCRKMMHISIIKPFIY